MNTRIPCTAVEMTNRSDGDHEARLASHHVQLLISFDDPLDPADGKDRRPNLFLRERLTLFGHSFLLLLRFCRRVWCSAIDGQVTREGCKGRGKGRKRI